MLEAAHLRSVIRDKVSRKRPSVPKLRAQGDGRAAGPLLWDAANPLLSQSELDNCFKEAKLLTKRDLPR